MKKQLSVLLVGMVLLLGACSSDEEKTDDVSAEAKLYNQKCASCHGGNLEGTIGPELTEIGSKMSKDEIESAIVDGIGTMPAKLLVGEEASGVAEWLAEHK